MSYAVMFTGAARRELADLPHDVQRRVDAEIGALAETPRGPGAVKLTGSESYRVRVGNYRVVFAIDDGARTVTILRIGHRREIYR